MITITEKAYSMLGRQGAGKNSYVRIGVKSGGCSGMTYDAEIDTAIHDDESIVHQHEDIIVISDKESFPFLDGLIIDYSDDLISAGFRFSNGNNESSCGCGASFALAGFPEISKGVISCGT